MTWTPIIVSKEEEAAFIRTFSKKARFLLDEDIDPSLAPTLRNLGWNVRTVAEADLRGHPDESVLAYAKREDRVLLTHDDGYLDDRCHPPHRNPGVIVIPQEEIAAIAALSSVLPIVGYFREIFRGDKIQVDADGTIKIKSTDEAGRRKTTRYRYSRGEHALQWEEGAEDG
jgi:predicted nuclease of predicted toxin-antitoxin system